MIERAVVFGANGALTGILTEPDAERAVADAPAVLMWNIGIHHRVGPYRVQVDIARELARRGYASLRFDVAGMGDSEMGHDSRTDEERSLDNIREAMNLLERRRGTPRFLPIGFCSSVDSAHAISLIDNRVVGACFIEGYANRTAGFWMLYPLRMFDTIRWKRRILRKIPALLAKIGRRGEAAAADERAALGSVFARNYPSAAKFASDVRAMAARGVRLLFVYVGGDTDFNHRGQFEEMMGNGLPGEHVDVTYYGGADHTFYRADDRRRAVLRVAEWTERAFPANTISAPETAAEESVRPAV
jgi:hypothetical protein